MCTLFICCVLCNFTEAVHACGSLLSPYDGTAIHSVIEMALSGSGSPDSADETDRQTAQTPMPPGGLTPAPCPQPTLPVSWLRKGLCYYQVSGRKKILSLIYGSVGPICWCELPHQASLKDAPKDRNGDHVWYQTMDSLSPRLVLATAQPASSQMNIEPLVWCHLSRRPASH